VGVGWQQIVQSKRMVGTCTLCVKNIKAQPFGPSNAMVSNAIRQQ